MEMTAAEIKILEYINAYSHMKYKYEKILNTFAAQDKNVTTLYELIQNLHGSMLSLGMNLDMYKFRIEVTAEEIKAFLRKLEIRAIDYYQRALEKNYEVLKQYKETGEEPEDFIYLIMTVDKDGNPKKSRVIDVRGGEPILEDGCEIREIQHTMDKIDNLYRDLSSWLDDSGTLKEKLEKALKLKAKRPFGVQTPSSPSYDLHGLSGERLDAAAWQIYVIEMNTVKTVDYNNALEELITKLQTCIEFYEKAISIV